MARPPERLPVAVLGATGVVGQRFVSLLADHPWFELRALAGADSAGSRYGKAVRWTLDQPLPESVAGIEVESIARIGQRKGIAAVFSALPAGVAGPIETRLARRGSKVFTNARDHRMDPDVPLVIPEVNPDAIYLVRRQPGPGWIVANGNCTAIVLTLALAPLHGTFGLDDVHVTSLQALSGAGHPGISALDITENVIPFIAGEEAKVETEPNKILDARIPIHATCTRVAVRDGHLESVHLRLGRKATLPQARRALSGFRGPAPVPGLPTAPKRPLHVLDEADRPQPRRDRGRENGMAVSVGRLRLDADGRGLRFVLLGHNAVRGAAGASLLNAELARARGLI